MSDKPLISIIIPIYKVEEYLRDCIDSVINQSFNNLEIILVDDGSPDNCPYICDEYQKLDSRVVVVHKKNGGLSSARNEGIRIASGDYLIFLDGDDKLLNCHSLINFLSGNAVDFIYFTSIKESLSQNKWKSGVGIDFIPYRKFITKTFFSTPYQAAWMFCINRNYLINNNLFFGEGLLHEDEDWMPRVVISSQEKSVPVCSEPLYWYRILRKGSIVNTKNEKRIESIFMICNKLINYYNETDSSLRKRFLATRISQLYNNIRKTEFYCNKSEGEKIKIRKFLMNSFFIKHKILYFLG